jgi:hypothetical protein
VQSTGMYLVHVRIHINPVKGTAIASSPACARSDQEMGSQNKVRMPVSRMRGWSGVC